MARSSQPVAGFKVDPLWYRNAVIYQLHVRAFHDSNGDGVGDFPGLTQKLDYLQDLGVTALWLMPFYPSPLRDDGYDISDYTSVNPAYGTMRDVRAFLREAHRRDIRVITELVINHTSDQHVWFQRARQARAGSSEREFYVWSDTPERYPEARVFFPELKASNWSWDAVARQYYWHRFFSHQPDLNFDNPAVHEAVFEAMEYWFDIGVDGMRLDAVPYLYEREGTSCENLPETHSFLRKLRAHTETKYSGRMFLAEANQWPEDAAAYFGNDDECHMNFHFPLMPRLFMAVHMEDRFPIIDILDQTPSIPPNSQWAVFLRNHDELTLEMVTDEERDYMYRVYASDRQARINLGIRRRLAPLMQNSRRRIELMNALLFSMPGSPVIYYGDEIGMGDNIYLGDRNGVRTPMQWSADRNAGFSLANPQKLFLPVIIDPEYRYEAVNVEAQLGNPSSLLWWMKRLIALRRRYPVLGTGSISFLDPENRKILAFVRRDGDQQALVIANLSRYVQAAELNLSAMKGLRPVEMFGQTEFPVVGDAPYVVTLAPHGFYWLSMEPALARMDTIRGVQTERPHGALRTHRVHAALSDWFEGAESNELLASILLDDLPMRTWFDSKARRIRGGRIVDKIMLPVELPAAELVAALVLLEVESFDRDPELYVSGLAFAPEARASQVQATSPPHLLATIRHDDSPDMRLLYDGLIDPAFARALFAMIAQRRSVRGSRGALMGRPSSATRRAGDLSHLAVHPSRPEQPNSSMTFGDQFSLKVFRAVQPGLHPAVEMTRFLTNKPRFSGTPAYAGELTYELASGERIDIGLLQRYVANEGDGWRYALDEVGRYYDRILAQRSAGEVEPPGEDRAGLLERARRGLLPQDSDLIGSFAHAAGILADRTAEMHAAFASARGDESMAPAAFSQLYQRALYQSMRNTARRAIDLLRRRNRHLDDVAALSARAVLAREDQLLARFREVTRVRLSGLRTRCHGDFRLGQTLWTGRDFVIVDFEGEPSRPFSERRLKTTPLRDVAGMVRSIQYAAYAGLRAQVERGIFSSLERAMQEFEPWSRAWEQRVAVAYLRRYLDRLHELRPDVLPPDEGLRVLFDAWMLEKALYEIAHELNHRPDWVFIPLRGVLDILDAPA